MEASKGIAPSQGYEESKQASKTAVNAVNTTAQSLTQISATMQDLDTQSRAMEGRLIEDIRSVAMKALDHLVEADAEDAAMKELFVSVVFERKEKEIDPYKVNVKTEKQRKKAEAAGVKKGFLFGSPSKRYPLSPGDHLASYPTADDDDGEECDEAAAALSDTIIEEDDQVEYEDEIAEEDSYVAGDEEDGREIISEKRLGDDVEEDEDEEYDDDDDVPVINVR